MCSPRKTASSACARRSPNAPSNAGRLTATPENAAARKTPKRPTPPALVPRRVASPSLDDHLEIITRAVFQAGLSWAFIAARWNAFREAFSGFAVRTVAAYDDGDLARVMAAPEIVHSQKKIEGTVKNANALLALEAEFGSVTVYVERFTTYAAILDDVAGRFAFVGDISCYYWLFRTGNAVPIFEEWIARQPRDHPRVREMVMAGRADATSSERAGF